MSSDLLLVALAGFFASMVDGALGMGFGPTSSSILLAAGISPGAVSASVNLAKMATGIAAALSHWRLGNIDKRLVLRLALPGNAIGKDYTGWKIVAAAPSGTGVDRKSTRLNSSHIPLSRMPSSA